MPLTDPIEEKMKPSRLGASIIDGVVPENIQPILTLMKCTAVAFKHQGADWWEITTEDGLDYIRVEQSFLGSDEAEWTKLVGFLLDYHAKKLKGGD